MKNIAGIKKIEYALASSISWLTPANNGVFDSFPEWETGADWLELPTTYLTGDLSFVPSVGAQGFLYSIEGQAVRAKIEAESLKTINDIYNENLVLLAHDRNDQVWLVGSPDYPVRLTYRAAFGSGYEQRNQFSLNIVGSQPFLPGIYDPYNYQLQNSAQYVFQNGNSFIYN